IAGNSRLLALVLAACACSWQSPGASAQGPPRSFVALDAPPRQVGKWSEVFDLGNVAVHTHVLPMGKVLFWSRHEAGEGMNPDPERTCMRTCDPGAQTRIGS